MTHSLPGRPPALLIDPPFGIAGDMTLAALVDLGASEETLRSVLETLPVEGWSLSFQRRRVAGIQATDALVHAAEGTTHRGLGEILDLIDAGRLPGQAAERARSAFRALAEAEAAVHDVPVESIHFHEVGALDAIVDIVGCAVALELLEVTAVWVRPVGIGHGTVRCAHGEMPVPSPATVRLLEGFPVRETGVPMELVTPTGAAMIRAWGRPVPPDFEFQSIRVGYGMGKRNLPSGGGPSLLRAQLILPRSEEGDEGDRPAVSVAVLEANVDDMTPELLPPVVERLLEAGALDAFVTPVVMKRGRPAFLITVLAPRPLETTLARLLMEETTTLGVRSHRASRLVAARRIRTAQTPFGPVRVKLARLPGGRWRAAPEFQDCAALARSEGIPLIEVMDAARQAATRLIDDRSDSSG